MAYVAYLPALVQRRQLRETLWVGAVGATLAFLPVLFSPIRSVREVPDEEPEPLLPVPPTPGPDPVA